jgi:hypothetical protein
VDELAEDMTAARRVWDLPDAVFGWLDRHAMRELEGDSHETPEQLMLKFEAITPTGVGAALQAAQASALHVVPSKTSAPSPVLQEYIGPRGPRLPGRAVHHVRRKLWRPPPVMHVGDAGLTLSFEAERYRSARFEDCAAVLAFSDGSRTLVSDDGSYVLYNPAEWVEGAKVTQWIASHIPPEKAVPMLPDAEAGTAVVLPAGAPQPGVKRSLATVAMGLGVISLFVVLLVYASLSTHSGGSPGVPVTALLILSLVAWRVIRSAMR